MAYRVRQPLTVGLCALALLAACQGPTSAQDAKGVATTPPGATASTPIRPAGPPVPLPARAAPARPTALTLEAEARQGSIVRGVVPEGTTALTLDGVVVPFDADGRFVVGFDRDAAATARLVVTGARPETRSVSVAPGQWRIEHVNAAMTGGAGTSAEFQRRRPAELARINAARRQGSDSAGWTQPFAMPVEGRISGLFGAQRVYRGTPGSYHSGVDIARPTGTPFTAPADGVVTLAAHDAPFTLEGHLLIIDHGQGLTSAFLHCSRLDVRAGDRVTQGQILGAIGASGRASGPHLHWGMKLGTARLDPLKVVAATATKTAPVSTGPAATVR